MPWNRTEVRKSRLNPRVTIWLVLAIGVVFVVAGAIVSFEVDRDDHAKGQAVIHAYQRAGLDDGADIEDGALADDEAAAGAMWARGHPSTAPGSCPGSPKAFQRGCADWEVKHATRP